jgi:cell division protein FtsB
MVVRGANILLLVLLLLVQWQIWLQPHGFRLYRHLERVFIAKQVALQQLQRRKLLLSQRLQRLLTRPQYVVGMVRQELNWVHGGELFYQYIKQ